MTPQRPRGTGSVFYRDSDSRWVAQIENGYTPSGARRYRTRSATTRAEAQRLLRDLQREQHQGITNSSRTTVKTWADQWLPQHATRVRASTYTTDRGAVTKWIIPTIGKTRLANLTPADIRSVHTAITTAGRSTTTARHAHGVLRHMLKDAKRDGHTVPDSALLVDPPARALSDRDAIPLPHALAILRAADGTPTYARWAAALLQGMRQAEVLGLTWECIDFDRGLIDVAWQLQALPLLEKGNPRAGYRTPPGLPVRQLHRGYHLVPPKTSAGRRVVPLTPWMHAALTEWRDQAPTNPWGLVWTGIDSRYGTDQVVPVYAPADRRAWNDLQDTAGVRHHSGRRYTLHEARHTTATMLTELGVDPIVLTAIMGHSSIASSNAYRHVSTTMARAALDKVAARLGLEATPRAPLGDAPG